MTTTVCLAANTLYYPHGGGHRWVYLNWALGLRALGCRVVWLEEAEEKYPAGDVGRGVAALRRQLAPYGLADDIALLGWPDGPPARQLADGCDGLDAVADADVLVSFRYGMAEQVVRRFRRSVLVDIDPGLLQIWMSRGQLPVAGYDRYLTTSEAVAAGAVQIPDVGVAWRHAPPPVALDWWHVHPRPTGAPFTTVSHWGSDVEWVDDGSDVYRNDKQAGFAPFADLPSRTTQPLELALCLSPWQEAHDVPSLRARGWRVRQSRTVAATPWDYQRYIQQSAGEFSWTKPSCVRLANAWVSDRTLCYLASGKPAVVGHTGPSRLLPDAAGLFRVGDAEQAARALQTIADHYDEHCRLARELAEESFDARQVAAGVLEDVL